MATINEFIEAVLQRTLDPNEVRHFNGITPRELLHANKYDLGNYDCIAWFPSSVIVQHLKTAPQLFTVPDGNTLVTFQGFMFVHFSTKRCGTVQVEYAIATDSGFYFCPHTLEADFTRDRFVLSSLTRLTKKQEKREMALFLTYAGTSLMLVNQALQAGHLHRNGNVRYLPARRCH